MPSWSVEHLTGDVGEFHARPLLGSGRTATFFNTESATLVLGSSQREQSVDSDAAARLGIGVVRRRSGGGGVLVLPGDFVWLDLEIPAGDELWDDDIGRSMWWVGELWRRALSTFEPVATVYRGPMRRTQWSSDICFAGTGTGEVLRDAAKLVGISQRRTRHAARFQTMLHRHWRPDLVASLVTHAPSLAELTPLVAVCTASIGAITDRLTEALLEL